MRLHRFFIHEQIGNRTELVIRSKELANQLHRVLRVKVGEEVILFDGSGTDYVAALGQFIGSEQAVFEVRSSSRSRYMPPRKVYLYAALVKKDNFEFIVEKATELGVTDIIPVIAERSEKKAVNQERLVKISVEASEQSGRGDVPTIHPVISLKEAIAALHAELNDEDVPNSKKMQERGDIPPPAPLHLGEAHFSQMKCFKPEHLVAFHTDGELLGQRDLQSHASKDESIAVFIGPEGGWSLDEIDMFHKNEIETRCLGAQVLRAETAVVAALSKVCL